MASTGRDQLCVNTIRFLAVDAVEKARSGHPGMPMGAAALAYTLWDRFLRHNPLNPGWANRDRFILSSGHASALLYALLHLTGYDLPLDELKNFRQWQSRTPGHIEYGLTPGVELTTGPLAQGFASGVGMAMAERYLAARYNRPDNEIIDHYTYAIVSDGDMEEGLSAEAASLAGTLKLGKLIYLYDKNNISIEGNTDIAFTEDVARRFEAYDWHVQGPLDGMDVDTVAGAIAAAQTETGRPSLIICRTHIGFGSPGKQDKAAAHGEPLGEAEAKLAKQNLGWPSEDSFYVPEEALSHFRQAQTRGREQQDVWEKSLAEYRRAYPDMAARLEAELRGELPDGWDRDIINLFQADEKPLATRDASGKVMNALAASVPGLIGGSADLAPSNKTNLKDAGDFAADNYGGRNLHFGVREHAMGAIANGMALHGGAIPYTGTFLVFYDYMRAAVRLAALMGIRVVYVFTHDSIGVGEDGPTHQPIEHVMGLRTVPGLVMLRPADATETLSAWRVALLRKSGPTALVLTRQKLAMLAAEPAKVAEGAARGGYVLWESSLPPEIILIGTGSETHIALAAGKLLAEGGIGARVVSLPSWELFAAQPKDYREAVLPPEMRVRLSIEAGTTIGWERFVGLEGAAMGIDHFGASAPAEVLYEKFGLTAQTAAGKARELLGR
jgi:transketolase